jgi:signal transduction histidine kinase
LVRSLKRRLTAIVISIFIASWLISALATSLAARVVVLREIDRVLESVLLVAESVSSSMSGDLQPLRGIYAKNMVPIDGAGDRNGQGHEGREPLRLHQNLYAGGLGVPSVNLWFSQLQLLVGDNTPVFPDPADGIADGEARNVDIGGETWRIMYRRSADRQLWMAAGIRSQQAQLDGTQLLLRMLEPLAVLIPLTALALYGGVARGLSPLRELAHDIGRRRETASLAALPAGDAPSELAPVVESLNDLLARLADTLENEKRFTANAAHELQTPLAAISAEVQLCHKLLGDSESRQMMERIRARVERAAHSVRQLLVLARLDPQSSLPMEPLILPEMIIEVASEVGHIASERRLELTLDIEAPTTIWANREALLILLRNLVSNAFRYATPGGAVHIAAATGILTMANDSPPIAEPGRLTDRFFRGSGDGSQEYDHGAGLGLSIAKRICELHGIAMTLDYRASDGRFVAALRFANSPQAGS